MHKVAKFKLIFLILNLLSHDSKHKMSQQAIQCKVKFLCQTNRIILFDKKMYLLKPHNLFRMFYSILKKKFNINKLHWLKYLRSKINSSRQKIISQAEVMNKSKFSKEFKVHKLIRMMSKTINKFHHKIKILIKKHSHKPNKPIRQ